MRKVVVTAVALFTLAIATAGPLVACSGSKKVSGFNTNPGDDTSEDGGTLVTSYYDWSAIRQSWKDRNVFPVIPESALRATLGILARTVARGYARPDSMEVS